MARSTMAALIARLRILINDTAGGSQQFSDDDIQNVMDAARQDVKNQPMIPRPTFTGATIQFLDYYTDLGDWEDDLVLKQYLINVVTPATSEPIAGHWTFATTTLPPIYISGKTYDIYRAAADLLERWAARWALSYSISVDGQSLQRGMVLTMLLDLAKTYRLQQRAHSISVVRTDTTRQGNIAAVGLGPTELDYMGSGGP